MAELNRNECDHLIGIWKICVKCETTISETYYGGISGCNCLFHYKCPVPRVRENHSCSLEFKQQLITNYVKKKFFTDDVRGAYRRYIENNYVSLINQINTSNLTKEECNLLMMCWRICYHCETKVEKTNQSNTKVGYISPCQCLYHYPSCPVPHARNDHSSACPLQLKTEIVTNYVRKTYQTDNARTAFKTYMRRNLPGLVDEAMKQNSKPVQSLPSTLIGGVESEPPSLYLTPFPPNKGRINKTPQPVKQKPSDFASTSSEPSGSSDSFVNIDILYYSELRIHGTLGKGGQGTVKLASNEFYKMAVKKFESGTISDYEALKKELSNSMKVAHHPNLIQIRGLLYRSPEEKANNSLPIGYAMEYMPGGSLHNVIHSQKGESPVKYDLAQLLLWTKQASSALHYLHQKNIIHRDVKPMNMLLDKKHQVLKLCDLGISTIIQTVQTATVGTLLYMAPEVMAPDQEKTSYTESCDVYSLVITIWEMYHRKAPFDFTGRNVYWFLNQVQRGERPKITQKCPSKLAEIIRRGWSPNVADRPSMREIHRFAVDSLKKLGVDCED